MKKTKSLPLVEENEISDFRISLAQFASVEDLKQEIRYMLFSQQKKGNYSLRLVDDGQHLHLKIFRI